MKLAILALVAALATTASAQPAGTDKADAKLLMQSGVKLLEAKDYLGALAIFKDGYTRFPSAKFLLNIGTTLKLLDRKAEAANAYQRYLDSPDADPQRRGEVGDALLDLDKSLGKLAITCEPAGAEVEVGDEWVPAAQARLVRVNPGPYSVHAREDGYEPAEKTGSVSAGQQTAVIFILSAIAKPQPKQVIVTVPREEVHGEAEPLGPRPRFGAFAMAHVSVSPRLGGAWLLGATADATEQLEVDAAVLLGPGLVSSQGSYPAAPPSYGGYLGASFSFLTDQWRPRVSFGVPMFESAGSLRFAVRGAGGVEYVASPHLALIAELGLEDNLNNEMDIQSVAVVPALAVSGRL
ncbi:MAG: PEGA domain-containing protein [Acidobacteriota bacterium]